MTRVAVGLVVALVLLGTVTAGSTASGDTTGETYRPSTAAVLDSSVVAQEGNETNETIEDLRDRVEELENKNSELKTKIVSKNGRIEQLELQLNQSREQTGFTAEQADRMKEMGAWDPEENEPALIVSRDQGFGPVIFQYVGPGNGQHSFNGQSAWTEVAKPEQDVRDSGQFSFSLKWGSTGMNTSYTVGSFAEYRNQIRDLEQQLNSPSGFTAWSRWNNNKRHSAQTFQKGTLAIGSIVVLGLMYGAAWVESKAQIVLSRRKKHKKRSQAANLDGYTSGSRLASVPVLGTIIERWRDR